MAVQLDQIVPWGRSFREYELMFALSAKDDAGEVLDCGGGPSSFTAELTAAGRRAVSVDPIYAYSGGEIRRRFEATAGTMLEQVRATANDYVWGYHRDPEDLLKNRKKALEAFLADYEQGPDQGRYIIGELPSLPFEERSFGVAVCSHLLFLYSDLLTAAFHVQSLRELCRVADEVRVFPLLNLKCEPSPHLREVRAQLEAEGLVTQRVRVDFEFQRGGNEMLRVARTGV